MFHPHLPRLALYMEEEQLTRLKLRQGLLMEGILHLAKTTFLVHKHMSSLVEQVQIRVQIQIAPMAMATLHL